MEDLGPWLLNLSGFSNKLKKLNITSVARQFQLTTTNSVTSFFDENDAGYMLLCGSILSHSAQSRCQDAALRIAQYYLTTDVKYSDEAALILDALSNSAAIRLAEKRELLLLGYEKRLSFGAQLESINRRVSHTIELHDKSKIILNNFQIKFWEGIEDSNWISVSAPTSAGKSFTLEVWIKNYIQQNVNKLIIYLVPTRALISQVEGELKNRLNLEIKATIVNVASLPLSRVLKPNFSNVLVFTQERLHIFLNSFIVQPKVDILIVDEAHKVGDGYRGVALQQVIENVYAANKNVKVIFASPFTSNPELLLEDGPQERKLTINSSDVTVNQNLIWVTQKPRKTKEWKISLCLANEVIDIGEFSLENSPSQVTKRLPFVALALSRNSPGNVIYVNGAADAEKTANLLYDSLPNSESIDSEVLSLIDLSEKIIHKKFLLNKVLKKGIAFHYGNIPLIVKSEIERLFSANKINYLICTSTLVEGVNMSCKNIFLRGPKKGQSSKMSAEDFWNLAGRAGRWGKEFQGNIFCIDADNSELWLNGNPPKNKSNININRTTDKILRDYVSLSNYINGNVHFDTSMTNPEWEYVFSYLAIAYTRFGSLDNNPYLKKKGVDAITALNLAVAETVKNITIPLVIWERNPGISPLLMESLLKRFQAPSDKSIDRFLLSEPNSDDALDSYTQAFARISKTLSNKLSYSPAQSYVRALLVIKWMRGHPLARLINDRIEHLKSKNDLTKDSTIIRDVMKDVEEIARYQAPRLLACYNDVLRFYYQSIDRQDLADDIIDLSVYLELGLNQQTQLALTGLGLSRTAAVMLSDIIAKDSMTEEECLVWLNQNDWRQSSLPLLVIAEIENSLKSKLEALI